MQRLLLLSTCIASALACQAGTGPVSYNAKFSFSIYPPVAWTFVNRTSNDATAVINAGAKPSSTSANTQITTDIQDVLLSVAAEYNGVSFTFTQTVSPVAVQMLTNDCTNAVDTTTNQKLPQVYINYGKTLYYSCEGTAANAHPIAGTLTLKSQQLIYQSQWNALAVKVQKKLQSMSVVFETPVNLDSQS